MPQRHYLYGQKSPTARSLDPANVKQAIVTCILDLSVDKGYAPTVKEITLACNLLSTATTQKYLNELVAEGRVQRDPKRVRTLRVMV